MSNRLMTKDSNKLMTTSEIEDFVAKYKDTVNIGRTILELVEDGEIPELKWGVESHEGKVSDSMFGGVLQVPLIGTPVRLMYRTNRVSSHDRSRGAIPFKDQVLGIDHHLMREVVRNILGTSQIDIPGLAPTSTVIVAENLEPLLYENVIRSHMAESSTDTSLYQVWKNNNWQRRKVDGKFPKTYGGHVFTQEMIDALEPNCELPYVMDTPSTKEKNDRTVSPDELIKMGVVTQQQYVSTRNKSFVAYGAVNQVLISLGYLMADTKTEHGINSRGEIVSMDELYTMESSRRWRIDPKTGLLLMEKGKPKSFSKQFVRDMEFDENGMLSDDQEIAVAVRFIEGIQFLTGKRFNPDLRQRDERIIASTYKILNHLGITDNRRYE